MRHFEELRDFMFVDSIVGEGCIILKPREGIVVVSDFCKDEGELISSIEVRMPTVAGDDHILVFHAVGSDDVLHLAYNEDLDISFLKVFIEVGEDE